MKAHRDETLVANALRALTESAQTKADAAFKDQSSNLLALAVDAARVRLWLYSWIFRPKHTFYHFSVSYHLFYVFYPSQIYLFITFLSQIIHLHRFDAHLGKYLLHFQRLCLVHEQRDLWMDDLRQKCEEKVNLGRIKDIIEVMWDRKVLKCVCLGRNNNQRGTFLLQIRSIRHASWALHIRSLLHRCRWIDGEKVLSYNITHRTHIS